MKIAFLKIKQQQQRGRQGSEQSANFQFQLFRYSKVEFCEILIASSMEEENSWNFRHDNSTNDGRNEQVFYFDKATEAINFHFLKNLFYFCF